MARLKQIVKRIEIEVAQRRRTCKFTGSKIEKGATCIVVFEGQRDRSVYSMDVARKMIASARARLDELEQSLGSAA